jgi:hypothetical protein
VRGKRDPRAAEQRHLLDFVLEDARRLRGNLGRDDQTKLDEYTESVRAIEKRIEFFSRPDPRSWKPEAPEMAAPAEAPGDLQAHVRLMLDLMVLAFQTDSTRVSTFMFANDVSGRDYSKLIPGCRGGHHELSHHRSKPEKYLPYAQINRWHVEQFAYLLGRMRGVREGDSTLLDNCMVMFGSAMSDGNRHDPANLPILLGGRGGGTIATGRHLACPAPTPLANLFAAMLARMGMPAKSFADSTQPMVLT